MWKTSMLLFTPSGFDYNQYMAENLNADTINQNWFFRFSTPIREKNEEIPSDKGQIYTICCSIDKVIAIYG